MRVITARAALFGTVAAAALFTTPASGQTAAQTTAEANKQQSGQPIAAENNPAQNAATGEIVVTARRTEERLQRVPASISAFNARALDRIQL